MDTEMKVVTEILQRIEEAEKSIVKDKEWLSRLLGDMKDKYAEAEKKFLWNNRWYLIKKRGDRNFITDYGDTEPGSWKRKKENS